MNSRQISTLSAIFASVFLLAGGSALQLTAISLRAGIEGFSETAIGLVSSGYYAGMLAGSFLALMAVREVGDVRSFAAFASLASATSIAHVLLIGPGWWILFRFLHGACISVVLVVVESWLNSSATNKSRGRLLSFYGIVFLAANALSQPLPAVFPPADFRLFAVTSILVSLCVLPVGLARVHGEAVITSIRVRPIRLFRKSPVGMSGVLVSGAVIGAHATLTPLFVQTLGLSDAAIGTFPATVAFGTIVLQIPLGWISDNRDRRVALVLSSFVGAIAAIGLAMANEPGFYLSITGLLLGGFLLPLYPLALAAVNDQLKADELLEAASAVFVFYGVGSMLGPLIAAAGMARFGAHALYLFIAGVLVAFLVFGIFRIQRVPDFLVRGAKATYRTVPRTTLVSYDLLRRPKKRTNPQIQPRIDSSFRSSFTSRLGSNALSAGGSAAINLPGL